MSSELITGDRLEVMRRFPNGYFDLVFGSPPYESARSYGIGFKLRGQDWVDWMVESVRESLRVCRGLVAFVVEGQTRDFRWSASPALLMADLHRAGITLRKPPAFNRIGIPGSGGPDWLRNDYEFIVCATNGGRLPWSNNTAMGHTPKYAQGGAMSNRSTNGQRANAKKKWGSGGSLPETRSGDAVRRPEKGNLKGSPACVPAVANPGNIIHAKVGGGLMGDRLCHECEAPFPESLAEFFIRSFCPTEGVVLDPFSGSGTTVAVADRLGRHGIGIDIRETMTDLAKRRALNAPEQKIA